MLTVEQLLEEWDGLLGAPAWATSGLDELDRATGGFGRGQVWVVTAVAGQGRTSLLTQWAVRLAGQGRPTRLVCPREPRAAVAARLLACAGRVPLSHLFPRRDPDRAGHDRGRGALRDLPLHVAGAGELTFLDTDALDDALPPAEAVLVDDADLVAGAFPDRMAGLARDGAFVVASLPRHLVVRDDADGRYLDPTWAAVADVVLEIRQCAWPGSAESLRPGEADLHLVRNRRGPTRTLPVAFEGHYARFVDLLTPDRSPSAGSRRDGR